MTSSGGASSSLPKWQLALVVGAPVALGLGYMYYKSSIDKPEGKSTRGKSKRKENGEKQISIDGDVSNRSASVNVDETQLGKSQRYKTEGNKQFNMGKFDEAISQYNLAIETCPPENTEELATFYQNRAAAYEKLKKYTAVLADCTKALELKPKYIKALIRRAKIMEHNNDLETALEDITAACMLEKFTNRSTFILADNVLKKLGKQHAQEYMATKKPVMPSKYFISTYFTTFRSDPIMAKINESLDTQENTPFNKALTALKNQEYDDVIPLCTQELNNLGPGCNDLHKMKVLLLRGTFYLLLGQHDKALEDLTTVITNEATSKEIKVNALIKRASMFVQLENTENCFVDFKEAENLTPDCGDIYHNRGQVYLLMEKVEEAKADFQKAVELNPDFAVVYVQRCFADYRYAVLKGDANLITVSISNFNNALEKFPECPECYTLYAQVLVDSMDFENADIYFTKACERDPKNATILIYKGLLQLQWKNDVDQAINYMRKAIEIDEKCEFAYETLGSIEVQRGNLKEAINLFDKALTLGRTSLEITHIFGLRDAVKARLVVFERLGSELKAYQES